MKSSAWEDQTEVNIRERGGRRKQERARRIDIALHPARAGGERRRRPCILTLRDVALLLLPAVTGADSEVLVAVVGVSCRQQIVHGTGRVAQHPIVLFLRLRSRVNVSDH